MEKHRHTISPAQKPWCEGHNPFLARRDIEPPRIPGQPPCADLDRVLGSIDFESDADEVQLRLAGGMRRVK